MYLKRSSLSHINMMEELRLEPTDWLNYARMDEESYISDREGRHDYETSCVTTLAAQCYTEIYHQWQLLPVPPFSDSNFLAAAIIHHTRNMFRYHNSVERLYAVFLLKTRKYYAIPVCTSLPRNQTEWLNISKDFNNKWQFPNCLGAADGKHVRIIPPSGSGSQYFNYKKYHSVVLMAVADANYSFIMCDVGASGSNSDGGCIQNTKFYQRLLTQQLNIPQPTNPPN
uniref:DDE Tnp4 domain-containing protein n=1 Tax=Anopheles stephensi TaxID=30069 RepID=A0A182YSR1_ANOST